MKRIGPDLKLPKLKASELKVPPFLSDLYWDLWDRRLLPLIAVLVVAIAAVPFVLGGGSEEAPPASPQLSLQDLTEGRAAATMTVVQAAPGLRDYHQRLGNRTPTDPFKQHTVAPSSIAHLNPMPSTSTSVTKSRSSAPAPAVSSTAPTNSSPEPAPSPSSGGGEESSPPENSAGNGGQTDPSVTLLAYAIDVKITRVEPDNANGSPSYQKEDSKKDPEPSVKRRVLPLTKLPGEKAPVVTYMGPSKKGKPLLLVSTDVNSIFGETKCLEGDEVCQLIEVEPGFPVVFVYGANGVRYRINVLKIEPVVVARK